MSQQIETQTDSQTVTRGRGAPMGKRPVYFVHAAVVNDELVMASYPGTQAVTAAAFKAEFGVDSQKVLGPVRRSVATDKKAQVSVKESVRLNSEQILNLSENKFSGTYKGWKVIGNGLEETTVGSTTYKQDELVRVILDGRVDAESKARKPRIGNNDALPVSLIEDLKQMS